MMPNDEPLVVTSTLSFDPPTFLILTVEVTVMATPTDPKLTELGVIDRSDGAGVVVAAGVGVGVSTAVGVGAGV